MPPVRSPRARPGWVGRALAGLLGAVLFLPVAHAAAPDDRCTPETVAVPIAGSDLVAGRSTVVVNAPLERVRGTILAFPAYPEFMPHYTRCRVLGRSPSGGRDVFMEVNALHGALRLWARVDFSRAAQVGDVETYEAKLMDGNIKELHAVWRLKRQDAGRTLLSLEVFLEPRLPLPTGTLNSENLHGASDAVAAVRDRSEGPPRG